MTTAVQVRKALREHGSPERAATSRWFFKTGKGQYGEGDVFIGVTVGDQRRVARQFGSLPLAQIKQLLSSKIHEERLTALLILTARYEKAQTDTARKTIFAFYIKNLRQINNWDLVDASAAGIVGAWLQGKDRRLLDKLAVSKHLWSRRVAMIATYHYIRQGSAEDALRIAALLLKDEHDLIHKASGWMLREVGKRVGLAPLRQFLTRHAAVMPRTMLRYSIEHLPASERKRWMQRR